MGEWGSEGEGVSGTGGGGVRVERLGGGGVVNVR